MFVNFFPGVNFTGWTGEDLSLSGESKFRFRAVALPGYPDGQVCCDTGFENPQNGTRAWNEADNVPAWTSSWCSDNINIKCKALSIEYMYLRINMIYMIWG